MTLQQLIGAAILALIIGYLAWWITLLENRIRSLEQKRWADRVDFLIPPLTDDDLREF